MNTIMMKKNNKVNVERNYGIDLLRIIAMLYVVILHVLGRGGVLSASAFHTPQYKVSWFMEIWAYGAVDIFALISGYVGYTEKEKKYNYSSYFLVWLQVVGYGVLSTLLFNVFHPELVSKKDLLQMFFPVTNGLYWYFTAYTGLFFIIPFLNMGVRKSSETYLKKLFIVILLIFTMFDKVVDRFVLSSGYSFVWITILYVMGAIIKKCQIGKKMKWYQLFLGIIICCSVSWGWRMYGKELHIFDIVVNKKLLVSYTSITVLLASIFHVICFSKIRLSERWKKVVKFAAPGAFAVYILNCQRFVWNYGMDDRFRFLANKSLPELVLAVITFSIVFVVGSILIDRVRILIFDLCEIKEVSKYLTGSVDKILTYFVCQMNGDENYQEDNK